VLSTVEDIFSVGLVFLAILVPVLVLVAVLALTWAVMRIVRRRRRKAAQAS
jgi:TRAP-type C4-dicarboxylate transport system permease large subunit